MTTKARKHGVGRRKATARARRERRLATLAGRQYGVVGRWQLVELGFGDEAIRVALASGRLHPLHREAYAVGHRIVVKRGKWLAAVLFDLGERSAPHELKSAWDEADRLKLLRVPEVARVYELGRGRRRARARLEPFLLAEQRHVEDTASPLEDRFAAFVVAHRLPPPQTNVLVDGDEVDALWPDARLIVELDSWEFHSHRAAFEKDRDRDTDHLLSDYRTVRVTHRRLSYEPERLATQLRALLTTPRRADAGPSE